MNETQKIRGVRKMNEKNAWAIEKLREYGFSDWESFGEYMLETTLDYIDYWAWQISGNSALEAYSSYNNIDFYEAILSFGDKFDDIAIELIEKMPKEIYDKINAKYHTKLELVISELEKEQKNFCLNECEYRESETCQKCEYNYLIE
jgi:hypothetical protein